MSNLGIVGGGNMGEAIISAAKSKYTIRLHEKDTSRVVLLQENYQIENFELQKLIEKSEIVIVAVKPQDIENVLKDIANFIDGKKVLVSIAAGITTAYIEKIVGKPVRVIRAMPNLNVMVAQGMTGLCSGSLAQPSDMTAVAQIFELLGKVEIVKEDLIDAITAVSGSGPAYVFLFIECLIKAAQSLGLNPALSKQLVLATFDGSVALLEKQNIDAGELRAKVTSKGGTTEAAIEVFLKNNLEAIMTEALKAAHRRAGELSKK